MEMAAIVIVVLLLVIFLLELLAHANLFIIRFKQNWKEEIGWLIFVIVMMSLTIYLLMIRPAQEEREGAIDPDPPVFHALKVT